MIKQINNKGFSLVEILIAIVVTSVILGAIMMSFTTSLRTFRDAKSISDNIETKTPSVELISRYFDRWGVGVVSIADISTCSTTVCPAQRKSLTITSSGGCSDVTFWGNIHGSGYVRDLSSDLTTANLYSCRLVNSPSNRNCYILWSNNIPMNPIVGGYVDPVSLPNNLSASNADCSNLPSEGSLPINATVGRDFNTSTNLTSIPVQSGDVIHRTPHRIRLYCNENPADGDSRWLYVDLTELSNGFCTDSESALPIAPVDSFTASAIAQSPLPAGTTCASATDGTVCGAVQVNVTFRSQSRNSQGQFDTYTATKVFGR